MFQKSDVLTFVDHIAREPRCMNGELSYGGVVFEYYQLFRRDIFLYALKIDGQDVGEVFLSSINSRFHERLNGLLSTLNTAVAKMDRTLEPDRKKLDSLRTPLSDEELAHPFVLLVYPFLEIAHLYLYLRLLMREKGGYQELCQATAEDMQFLRGKLQDASKKYSHSDPAVLHAVGAVDHAFHRLGVLFEEMAMLHDDMKRQSKPRMLRRRGE